MKRLLLFTVLLAACSGAGPDGITSPPVGLDPIVRGINHAATVAYVAWYSQAGLHQVDTFPGNSDRCAAFTSATPIDSIRFVAWIGDTLGAGWSKQTSPWFDPRSGLGSDPALNALNYPHGAEFWTVTIANATTFTMAADSLQPCTP